ncbi:hypothetical protein [Photobacterium sp. J15]|uniref:hypothetical protein n=1 Tax=Photobacterium sp. J15 TaxID=265901 RepID=UPI0007E4B9D9|nr:hypothetical protein [Photobacterium sp. J15]
MYEPLIANPLHRKAHVMLVERGLRPTKEQMKSEEELQAFIYTATYLVEQNVNRPERQAEWKAYLESLR